MKWARLFGWTPVRRRRPPAAAGDDLAGMGTAFGLDASVEDHGSWRMGDEIGGTPARGAPTSAGAPATSTDRIVRRFRL